ncbi:hypothetical protein [Tsukamurella soli]|uniref:Uncharacterized protein n=1 Tax=Tsukamurella soli TaxID=644556 RepID=A0ABP8JJ73_9ACTN
MSAPNPAATAKPGDPVGTIVSGLIDAEVAEHPWVVSRTVLPAADSPEALRFAARVVDRVAAEDIARLGHDTESAYYPLSAYDLNLRADRLYAEAVADAQDLAFEPGRTWDDVAEFVREKRIALVLAGIRAGREAAK